MDTLTEKKSLFVFKGKRAVTSMVLAAITALISFIWFYWYEGILFAAGFLIVGCLNVRPERVVSKYIAFIVWSLIVMLVTLASPLALVNGLVNGKFYWFRQLLNVVCFVIVCLFVFIITGKLKASVITTSTIMMILAPTN